MRLSLVVLAVILVARSAAAEPTYSSDSTDRPKDDQYAGEALFRPPIEWSTWIRGSYGAADNGEAFVARRLTPPTPRAEGAWDFGLGVEASLALSQGGNLRLGGWSEVRGVSMGDVFAGAELVLTKVPRRWDMFLYEGHGTLTARVGRSTTHETAAITFGYLAPFWLEGRCEERFFGIRTGVCEDRPRRHTRYMAGVRVVGTVTRAIDDPRAWSATLGLEFEPAGALRMLLGLRSWY
ncbi:MAG: hypothetical protein SFX73_16400 [Kofleriaceae bacterium]|nr:hypothetical protein [Kofleriaceae bacterium]